MSDQEASKISRYLLGDLPPEEMDALECRLLTESGLFELAESVEDEIIDRYVRGELSPAESRRFERRLLPSQRIQERVAFAHALVDRGATKPARKRRPDRPAPVIPLFRSPVRLAWAATLVACLAAGALGFEVFQLRDRAGDLERDRAAAVAQLEEARRVESSPAVVDEQPGRDPEAERLAEELTSARARIATLEAQEAAQTERRVRRPGKIEDDAGSMSVFLPLATRATGAETETLKLADLGDADHLELQLDLDGQLPHQPVIATVFRDGQPVWRKEREGLKVKSLGRESMALLELPREAILQGRYRIELAEGEVGQPELLGTYELSIIP
jgi:hypothetical protein